METFPVNPCNPVAPYLGGKRNLAARIVALINQIPHTTYAEPFVGMGGVFLRRDLRPKAEVINDYNHEVATLFRILQRHFVPFMDELKWKLSSRAEFNRLMETKPDTLTDIERAARFLYLQRQAFGGKISGRNFGVDGRGTARFDIIKLAPMLADVHERLASVTIECLDYKAFIDRYDHDGCLFYMDPPYFGCENDYGRGMFERGEFSVMAEQLAKIKGKFILSLNDRPAVREIFSGFNLLEVETTYTIAKGEGLRAGELLISNVSLATGMPTG